MCVFIWHYYVYIFLNVCKALNKVKNITEDLIVSSCTCDKILNIHFCLDGCTIVNCVVPLCVYFPDLFIGAHAKKQGEDLADNDGDEDEGILFGDEGGSMSLNLFGILFFLPRAIWMKLLVYICISLIVMTDSISTARVNVNEWGLVLFACIFKSVALQFFALEVKYCQIF